MLLSEKLIAEGRLSKMLGIGALAAGTALAGQTHNVAAKAHYNDKQLDKTTGMCNISVDADGFETRSDGCGDAHAINDAHRIAHLFNSCTPNLGNITVVKDVVKDGARTLKFSDGTMLFDYTVDAANHKHFFIIKNDRGQTMSEYWDDDADKLVLQAHRYVKAHNAK